VFAARKTGFGIPPSDNRMLHRVIGTECLASEPIRIQSNEEMKASLLKTSRAARLSRAVCGVVPLDRIAAHQMVTPASTHINCSHKSILAVIVAFPLVCQPINEVRQGSVLPAIRFWISL
jgi:hypothetical protein